MPLHEQQRFEILDRLAHEGETQLLFAPLEKPPLDLPPGWSELLACRDPGPAALQLWGKMRPRLPRIARAFEHRLHGLALLRTEEVPASLVYIFQSGQEVFAYRGSPPVSTPPDAPELRDFYSVHDGWVSLFTEDDGPMPTTAWNVLRKPLWPETQWRVHPGAGSLENFAAIYVDEDEEVFAIDTSKPLTQPLICRPNGTVEPMADLWDAIDREVGEFLLELDPAVLAPPPSEAFVFPPSDQASNTWRALVRGRPPGRRLLPESNGASCCWTARPFRRVPASSHLRRPSAIFARVLELGPSRTQPKSSSFSASPIPFGKRQPSAFSLLYRKNCGEMGPSKQYNWQRYSVSINGTWKWQDSWPRKRLV